MRCCNENFQESRGQNYIPRKRVIKETKGMNEHIEFTAFGLPQTAGSKSAIPYRKSGGKLGVIVKDANPKTKSWQGVISNAAAGVILKDESILQLFDGPLAVEMMFFMPRPRSHYRTGKNAGNLKASAPNYPDRRPDVLKLARAVEDACTGIVWTDDARIVDESLKKFYGEPARVNVRVYQLDEVVQHE